MGRRHADVDDRDVGLELGHEVEQRVGVARLAHDLEAGLAQEPRQALAQDQRVVGQDYPHGSSATRRVPAPGGLSTRRVPLRASTRSARPRRPLPARGVGPAAAVVANVEHQPAVAARRPQLDPRRAGVPGDVGQRLRRDVVRRRLDRLGQAARQVDVERDRDAAAVRELAERLGQAALREHRRVDAATELAQLLERLQQALPRLAHQRSGVGAAVAVARRASASPSAIAMETSRCCAPSCRLRSMRRRSASAASTMRVRDAASSSSRARSSASSRSLVSARAAAAVTDAIERRVAPDRRVVHQHRDLLALVHDRRHGALGAVGQVDGVARGGRRAARPGSA